MGSTESVSQHLIKERHLHEHFTSPPEATWTQLSRTRTETKKVQFRIFSSSSLCKTTSSLVEHWDWAKTKLCNASLVVALRVREARSPSPILRFAFAKSVAHNEPVCRARFRWRAVAQHAALTKHTVSSMHSIPRLTTEFATCQQRPGSEGHRGPSHLACCHHTTALELLQHKRLVEEAWLRVEICLDAPYGEAARLLACQAGRHISSGPSFLVSVDSGDVLRQESADGLLRRGQKQRWDVWQVSISGREVSNSKVTTSVQCLILMHSSYWMSGFCTLHLLTVCCAFCNFDVRTKQNELMPAGSHTAQPEKQLRAT